MWYKQHTVCTLLWVCGCVVNITTLLYFLWPLLCEVELAMSAPIMREGCTWGFYEAGFLLQCSMLGISVLMVLIQWPRGLLALLTTGVNGTCSDILQDVSQLLNVAAKIPSRLTLLLFWSMLWNQHLLVMCCQQDWCFSSRQHSLKALQAGECSSWILLCFVKVSSEKCSHTFQTWVVQWHVCV